jgi:hypothetical protein
VRVKNKGKWEHYTYRYANAVPLVEAEGSMKVNWCDDAYRLIRATLPTRETFFQDIRALMRYHCFPSWAAMMDFMMRGLEIGPYATQEA